MCELDRGECRDQRACLVLAMSRERDVGSSGVSS